MRYCPIEVPCNKCKGCRIAKAMEWGIRCHHEAQFHEHNCFLTLTYNDQHLPEDYSVDPRVFELFMKRLREKIAPLQIRFFGCGEYGNDQSASPFRPHYHAIIFGYAFPDRRLHGYTKRGDPLFISAELAKLWPFGFHTIGAANWKTAAYTARYTLKKIGSADVRPAYAASWDEVRNYQAAFYNRLHPKTRKLVTVRPEFLRMSRRPGLGKQWALTYKSDYFPSDQIVLNGKAYPVPTFYYNQLSDEERKFLDDERAFEAQSALRIAERDDKRRFAKMINREAATAQLKREL